MTPPRSSTWWQRARGEWGSQPPVPDSYVPGEHVEAPAIMVRRRLVVSGAWMLGTGLLGTSLSREPGSPQFYGLTAAVAATWTAGGLLSGPLHPSSCQSHERGLHRPIGTPTAAGVAAFTLFAGCALAARKIPALDRAISDVLAFTGEGSTPIILATTLANGLGEEVFFRGALHAAINPDRAVAVSTALYTLTTASTRNPALVLAAALMGTLFSLQRQASGGLQAPALTHLTWSTLMVCCLPPLFHRAHRATS